MLFQFGMTFEPEPTDCAFVRVVVVEFVNCPFDPVLPFVCHHIRLTYNQLCQKLNLPFDSVGVVRSTRMPSSQMETGLEDF